MLERGRRKRALYYTIIPYYNLVIYNVLYYDIIKYISIRPHGLIDDKRQRRLPGPRDGWNSQQRGGDKQTNIYIYIYIHVYTYIYIYIYTYIYIYIYIIM